MTSVHQLVYRSLASSIFHKEDINSILASCKKNNPEMDITGMLVYNNDIFLQMIEGDKLAISKLYNKISVDPRHLDLRILWQGESEERTFPHWSMAFKDITSVPATLLKEHQDIVNMIFDIDEYDISKGYKLFRSLSETI